MDRKHERKDGLTVVDKSSLAREMIETAVVVVVVVVETAILVLQGIKCAIQQTWPQQD